MRTLLRRFGVLACAGALVTSALAISPSATPPAAAQVVAPATVGDAAHPYSDPVWFPLRTPSTVSCVRTNCAGPYHGHWAIDFLGNEGDPVHPAGAGVFHIGETRAACPTNGVTEGTWVWVDHGAAGVTRYHHLSTITAKEGQLVTPATVIGTMGHSGNQSPCRTNYLHVEYRNAKAGGPFNPIPALRACSGSTLISLPQALGSSSWDAMEPNVTRTPSVGNACMPSSWSTTPTRPAMGLSRGSHAVTVVPSARPVGVTAVKVRLEEYHPSLRGYGAPTYRTIPATQRATTFSGLQDGHTFRVTLAFHNATGWSAWAPSRTAIPASPPAAPRYRGLSSSATTMSYLWYRVSSYGTSAATYQVAKRCVVGSRYAPWTYSTVKTPAISYQWRSLKRGTVCQVTVRAHNPVGWSGWSTRHSIRTKR